MNKYKLVFRVTMMYEVRTKEAKTCTSWEPVNARSVKTNFKTE